MIISDLDRLIFESSEKRENKQSIFDLDPEEYDEESQSDKDIVFDETLEITEVIDGREPAASRDEPDIIFDSDFSSDVEASYEPKVKVSELKYAEYDVTPELAFEGYVSPSGELFKFNSPSICEEDEDSLIRNKGFAKVKVKHKDDNIKLCFTYSENLTEKQRDALFPSFERQVEYAVSVLLQKIDTAVPVTGNFAPVYIYFDNLDSRSRRSVGKYGFCLYKMPEKIVPDERKRFLELAAYAPSGGYKADELIAAGDVNEIKQALTSPGFIDKASREFEDLRRIIDD